MPDSAILFLHDGELSEIRESLSTLGAVVIERNCGLAAEDRARPWDVIVASSKRMLELPGELIEDPGVRIAVLEGDSKTLRTMLRRAGTDLVVRRPVHPSAVRLLILHSLYRGPEKRRTSRVSIGAAVRFRSGLRRRNAILAELSTNGCRLLAPIGSHSARQDGSLSVLLDAELCGGKALTLPGRIIRIEPGEYAADAIAVGFDPLRPATAQRLRALIDAHSDGPAVLATATPAGVRVDRTAVPEPGANPPPTASGAERRDQPRHEIERRIIALGEQAARVLVGRDLSAGGMRVDAAAGLEVGDRMKIALHVHADGQPLVIDAQIARDDGSAGLALRFVDLTADEQARLAEILAVLPTICEARDSAEGIFVSEMLERIAG